ncbi:MAG: peptidylprolyl isomerase [Candidatus Limnocylindrales bacterium]
MTFFPPRRSIVVALMALAIGGCSAASAPTPASNPTPASSPVPAAPSAAGPSAGSTTCPTSAPPHAAGGSTATATIQTPKGTIVVKLEADLAPAAVGDFIALATCGYYDGVVFHRLVPGFVIQGGDGQFGRSPNVDPTQVGAGGPGYTIDDDPVSAAYGRGVVAMARTQAPHSEGSQFFIVLDDAARPALASANTYAIIGHVTSGMNVVDAIAAMPNSGSPSNAAIAPVPMTKVTITTP